MLGDTIEKVTAATGLKAAFKKMSEVANVPCGCEKRKVMLNNPNLLINKILYRNTDSKESGVNYNNM